MAKSDGTVYVDTRIDTKGFGKGVNTMQKQIGRLTGAIGKLGLAIAATFAVKKLFQFGKEAIDLGSDLQEVQNVVDVTFTTMNEAVNEFAQNAAETAGLSETMAKRYTGTFGAMAKAFGFAESEAFDMSTSLTQLAGDVASFYNLTQDEAYTKLKSVFSGETETLKDLGVVMTQTALDSFAMAKGYGKTTKQMTEQEKVALRYAFVLDQLSAASGDFVRTQDSWANQTRILSLNFDSFKANIGQALINIFTPFLKVINQIVAKMAELSKYFVAFSEMLVGKSTSGGGGSPGDALAEIESGYDGIAEATKEATKEQNKYLSGLDEIHTFSDNSGIETSGTSGGGLGGLSETTGEEVEDTSDLIAELEKKYPKLIKFAQDSVAKLKEIFADFSAGDFFEAGKDVSDLVTGIFDFISEAIDDVDWEGIGKKIGDFLAGIDWKKVITSAFKLKFNIWKAIAEVWFGAFKAAPIETTVITALAALKWTGLGKTLAAAFTSAIQGKGFVSAITGAFSSLGGIGGILTTDLSTIIGAGSATEIGLALGSYIIGGLLAAFVGNEIGKKIGAAIFPDMKEEYENFKWFGEGGFFDEMSNTDLDTLWSAIVLMSEDANGLIGMLSKVKKEISGTSLEFEDMFIGLDDLIKIYSPLIKDWFEDSVQPWLTKEKWKELGENIKSGLLSKWEEFKTYWQNTAISKWFNEDVKTWFTKEKWSEAMEGIKEAFSKTWKGAVNVAIELLNKFIDYLNEKMHFDWEPFKVKGKEIIPGGSIQLFTVPKIPMLATGAVIPPNAPFMAMLGDQKHGTNIEAPLDTIKQAVREVVGNGGGRTLHNYLYLDSRLVYESVMDEAEMDMSTTGHNPFDLT